MTDWTPRAYRSDRAGWVAHLARRPGDRRPVETALDRWLAAAPHVVAAVEQVDPLTDPYEALETT